VVIGSVVPSLQLLMEDAFDQLLPTAQRLVVSHTTPLPVANTYPVPSEVGIDRLANAVGGFYRFGAPCIVVDFGTATTIDVLAPPLAGASDTRPRYLGGIILPGPRLAAEALNLRTARLPMVSPRATERIIADNTVEAIRSGLFWGMVGAIDYLIQEAARESQLSSYIAVATGGLGRDFLGRCKTLSHYEPELTLFGLHEIARFQRNTSR
jgi:type III pantothenate kinase